MKGIKITALMTKIVKSLIWVSEQASFKIGSRSQKKCGIYLLSQKVKRFSKLRCSIETRVEMTHGVTTNRAQCLGLSNAA